MRSVLIVDDNAGDRHLLELAIEESGWPIRVSTAADGQEAMQILEARAVENRLPDLMLIDLNMPRVNGWDLLGLMHDQRFRGIRRVVLTSSRSPIDCDRALRLGAQRCLTKPFGYAELAQLIHDLRVLLDAS
jgi:CheY-like chemotaxis protein